MSEQTKYLGQVLAIIGFVFAGAAHGFGILVFCFCCFVYSVIQLVLKRSHE